MDLESTKEKIKVKSYLGNDMTLKISQIEEDKFVFEFNDDGFILDSREMAKLKDYLSDKICTSENTSSWD